MYSIMHKVHVFWLFGWLFWSERPFETVFQSISDRFSEREREREREMTDKTNVQTTPTRTYCKRSRPLFYSNSKTNDAPALEVYPLIFWIPSLDIG